MSLTLEQLQERLLDLQEQSETILATANAEKRDLTEDEGKQIDALLADQEKLERDIKRIKSIANNASKLTTGTGRKTEPAEPESIQAKGERHTDVRALERPEDRGKGGFRSFGEFALVVKNGSHRGSVLDPRLARMMDAAPGSYGSEGVGSDGGFAVPPDFRREIMVKVMGEESLIGRTDQLTTSSNSITVPVDSTTPWQTSGGIQAFWTGEALQKTPSKPALEQITATAHKLTCLVPVTDELLEDAAAMDAYLRRKAPEKMDFKVNLSIISGTGAGMPLGILNSGAVVSVAKETSQVADTIVAANLTKMWGRLYAPSRPRAIWIINQDVESQIQHAAILIKNVAGSENVGGMPVYVPPGGFSQSPYATLFGRPIVPTEAANALGDQGDIILADLGQYMTVIKSAGIRTDVSMHLWFDYDITAYRFVLRIGGQPWWAAPISRRSGSNTLSPFVTLDERA